MFSDLLSKEVQELIEIWIGLRFSFHLKVLCDGSVKALSDHDQPLDSRSQPFVHRGERRNTTGRDVKKPPKDEKFGLEVAAPCRPRAFLGP